MVIASCFYKVSAGLLQLRILCCTLKLLFNLLLHSVAGPFLIALGDIYWKVNERNRFAIEGTTQVSQASLFFIIPTDNGDHPYEFIIGWHGDGHRALQRGTSTLSQDHGLHTPVMFRYLDANVNIFGRNSGPLYMRNDIHEHNARFSLHSRLFKKHMAPVDLREWVLGNDQFFVNCARRRGRIDGFLAMKRVAQRGGLRQAEYTSVCVPSIKYHNEVDAFMLFSLISPRVKEGRLSPANNYRNPRARS